MSIEKVVSELVAAIDRLTVEAVALREMLGNQSSEPAAKAVVEKPKLKVAKPAAAEDGTHDKAIYTEVRDKATSALNAGLSKERVRKIINDAGGEKLSVLNKSQLVDVANALDEFLDSVK